LRMTRSGRHCEPFTSTRLDLRRWRLLARADVWPTVRSQRAGVQVQLAVLSLARRRVESMTEEVHSYSLPDELEPDLGRVHAYWNGLKRGANDVPFWDDVKFSMRSRLGRESMLIDVFENPLRFRFDLIGADLTEWYGGTIGSKFLDEINLHAPFDDLTLQCQATVEGCAPTYYCQTAVRNGDTEHPAGYARLLLPLWGNGRIEMLLGAVVLDKAARENSG